ncbi:MAG: sulfatase-like hydrolase/transferase, partial [Chloroflexota bacterium]
VRGQLMGPTRDNVVANWRNEADRFAPTTMRVAAEWLEHHYDDKFFLYVDTWDPHEPWQPPKHYIDRYDSRFRDETAAYPTYWDWKEAGYTQRDIDIAHTHYCAEISMVDRAVGSLLERVASLGLMDNTIIFFVSDHGFYFGEHGLWGKGRYKSEQGNYLGPVQDKHNPNITLKYRLDDSNEIVSDLRGEWYRGPLYEEITRVPFMVYVPDHAPKQHDALVCLPDIVPTILDFVGIDVPERVQAKSLVDLLSGKADAVHDFVVSSWPMYAPGQTIRVVDDEERNMREHQPSTIRTADWSMLYSIAGEPVELYDMANDPHQTTNVFSDHVAIAEGLHQQLLAYLTALGTDDVFLTPRQTLQ